MTTFTFKCLPPNEPFRTVDITAATLAEATQRANALWCHQTRPPELVATKKDGGQV